MHYLPSLSWLYCIVPSKANRALSTLTQPKRVKEASTLELRIAQCEAASSLTDQKKLQSANSTTIRGYMNVLREHINIFPLMLTVRVTARMSADFLQDCLRKTGLEECVKSLRHFTKLLLPWTSEHIENGEEEFELPSLMDPDSPSFLPILARMLDEDAEAFQTGFVRWASCSGFITL